MGEERAHRHSTNTTATDNTPQEGEQLQGSALLSHSSPLREQGGVREKRATLPGTDPITTTDTTPHREGEQLQGPTHLSRSSPLREQGGEREVRAAFNCRVVRAPQGLVYPRGRHPLTSPTRGYREYRGGVVINA